MSPLISLEKRALQFIDVTDNTNFTIELVDNLSQPSTDSEDNKPRKKNKHANRKKTLLDNFHASIQVLAASFIAFLLSHPAFISCLRSFTPL